MFTIHDRDETGVAVVATAVHAGHDLRPEIAERIALPAADRWREEDPMTDRIAGAASALALAERWGATARAYARGHLTLLFACAAVRRDLAAFVSGA